MRSVLRAAARQWWIVSLAVLCLRLAPASAQDLGLYSSGQQIALPIDISQLEGEIAIEINSVDVTDFAEIDGDRLLVTLGPLADGLHQVTVYLYQGASYEIVASYSFTSGGAGGDRTGSVKLTGTHEIEGRWVNGDTTLEAKSSGELTFDNPGFGVSGRVGYVASSIPAEQINGRTINITEYAFQVQRPVEGGITTGIIGHQTLSFDPLVVNALNRRGVGLSYLQDDGKIQANFFAVRAEDALGIKNITGLSEHDDRILGARIAFTPRPSRDLTFSVQGYSGRGAPSGALLSGEGSGWSLGVEGSARDGRLRFGLHGGETRWDEDGDGPLAPTSGDVVSARLEYDVLDGAGDGRSLTLGLTYDAQEFDAESLANPGLLPGGQVLALSADYSTERLWLNAALETQRTNYRGPSTLEVDRINRFDLSGTWDLLPGGPFEARTLAFGGYYEEQTRMITPPAAIPPEDYRAAGFNLGLDLSNARNSLSLAYSLDYTDEESPFYLDELYQTINLDLTHEISQNLSLTGGLSSTFVDDTVESWWTHDATLLLDYQSGGPWRFGLEVAATETDDPFASDGRLVSIEASRPLRQVAELVLYASYAGGGYVETTANNDKVVGFILRASTDVLR